MIRVLVVEDEPLAVRRLRRLLKDERDVKVVGACGDVPAARREIAALGPDLLLLDVQLSGADGLALLDGLPAARRPAVIFVTAYERYAVPAFDHQAVDYLLKPIDPERFRLAIARARRQLERRDTAAAPGAPLSRLLVRERGRAFFVRVAEVDWFEAQGNYVRVHVGRASHRLRTSIGALEPQLDPRQFRRINRSQIVALDRVRELQPWFHGDGVVILTSDVRLRLSRRYRDRVYEDRG
ncbi:MAG TPA: LytTR family DNA-binding domain-containing protein [Gemmatimonadales bacterium]|nr:LytTR family DNA-binding domain-containing protein [Gemmatimonadales bacterium]